MFWGKKNTRLSLTLLHPIIHVYCISHIHALKIRHCLVTKEILYPVHEFTKFSWPLLNLVMTLFISSLICYLLHLKILVPPISFMISERIFRTEITSSKISANLKILVRPHCFHSGVMKVVPISDRLLNYQFQYRPLFTFKR